MKTVRDCIEELRPLHAEVSDVCCWCRTKWPCGHSLTLDAALEQLNNGDFNIQTGMNTIPDQLPDRT